MSACNNILDPFCSVPFLVSLFCRENWRGHRSKWKDHWRVNRGNIRAKNWPKSAASRAGTPLGAQIIHSVDCQSVSSRLAVFLAIYCVQFGTSCRCHQPTSGCSNRGIISVMRARIWDLAWRVSPATQYSNDRARESLRAGFVRGWNESIYHRAGDRHAWVGSSSSAAEVGRTLTKKSPSKTSSCH